ncbi:hypothetical protein Efla_004291 [Eimeria flavescens]
MKSRCLSSFLLSLPVIFPFSLAAAAEELSFPSYPPGAPLPYPLLNEQHQHAAGGAPEGLPAPWGLPQDAPLISRGAAQQQQQQQVFGGPLSTVGVVGPAAGEYSGIAVASDMQGGREEAAAKQQQLLAAEDRLRHAQRRLRRSIAWAGLMIVVFMLFVHFMLAADFEKLTNPEVGDGGHVLEEKEALALLLELKPGAFQGLWILGFFLLESFFSVAKKLVLYAYRAVQLHALTLEQEKQKKTNIFLTLPSAAAAFAAAVSAAGALPSAAFAAAPAAALSSAALAAAALSSFAFAAAASFGHKTDKKTEKMKQQNREDDFHCMSFELTTYAEAFQKQQAARKRLLRTLCWLTVTLAVFLLVVFAVGRRKLSPSLNSSPNHNGLQVLDTFVRLCSEDRQAFFTIFYFFLLLADAVLQAALKIAFSLYCTFTLPVLQLRRRSCLLKSGIQEAPDAALTAERGC